MKFCRMTMLCILACGFIVAGCNHATPPTESKPARYEVRINEHTWLVELAMTDEDRHVGLSGRREIADDGGMLFVFKKPKELSFCMRGCPIPIDILFIDPQGRVVNLYAMQVESNRAGSAIYKSHLPACYALELAGGTIKRLGLKVGDKVELPANLPDRSQADE